MWSDASYLNEVIESRIPEVSKDPATIKKIQENKKQFLYHSI